MLPLKQEWLPAEKEKEDLGGSDPLPRTEGRVRRGSDVYPN